MLSTYGDLSLSNGHVVTESFDGGLYEFVTNDRLNSYLSLQISTKLSGKCDKITLIMSSYVDLCHFSGRKKLRPE